MTSQQSPSGRASARPWLTRTGERLLERFSPAIRESDTQPLESLPARLLIVKVHGMGDAVLVRCLIEHLRRRHPWITIGVMAGRATSEVLTMAADFRLHEYSQSELNVRSALRTLRQIRACAYDAIVNFEQGSLAGTGFLRATGIPNRLGLLSFANSAKAAFLTHCLAFRAQDSMWQSFGRLLRLVDPSLPADLPPMPLPLAEAAVQHARAWLEARVDGSYVRKTVFHLGCGAGQPFKRWPIASFAALARRLAQSFPDQSIILTGQPSERALVEEFNSQYGGPSIDATGLTSLALTAGVLSQADLLVSNDTGIMHLGAAVGTPTVGLFGASSPDQWAPFGPRVSYVYATKLGCSPCINSYLNIVPDHCGNRDVGGCMADINPEVVFAAARKVIRGSWLD